MRLPTVLGIIVLSCLTGCSSVSIVPQPTAPGAVINPSDNSIQITRSDVVVSARVQDTAVGGYDITTAIGSFYLTLNNRSGQSLEVTLDAFTLVDGTGESHAPLAPENVNAILNPSASYLMPYPFVGYYDVIDLEQYRARTALASERAYIGDGLPAAEELIPLPTGKVDGGRVISGILYFEIEMIEQALVELRAVLPLGAHGRKLSFSFPFSIEK